MSTIRLAVLLSGGGRTLENLAGKIERGELPARITAVVSSHDGVFGLERARRLGLPAQVVDWRSFRDDEEGFSAAVTETVMASSPDLVALAGFIRRWRFPAELEGRVMNIHPALLPAFGGRGFYGSRVHEAVIASGVRFSGCTVHFADHEYDTGPIILQRVVPVLPDDTPDTLAERVFAQECEAYPEAIHLFAEGRLEIRGRRVLILPSREEREERQETRP